jgi:aminoglycoside phosphotransferase (APT) family kinase protein
MPDKARERPEAVVERVRELLAPLGPVLGIEPLSGGLFATAFRVVLGDGTAAVVKIAPADSSRLLTYEYDLMRAEALVYDMAEDRPELLMPRLLWTDFTRTVLDDDVIVASFLPGEIWDRAGFGSVADDPRAARAQRDLGRLMARLHTTTGPHFGYLVDDSPLTAQTWPRAFELIVEALICDAARWAIDLPVERIRDALARHHDALAEVERPSLIHHDLWPGNLFVDPATGELVGVIDPERALWGDPLLELVAADQAGTNPLPIGLLAGYAEQSGRRIDVSSPSAVARLRLYRVMWSLIWIIEAVPRQYEGEFAAWYVATARANLETALDHLLTQPQRG